MAEPRFFAGRGQLSRASFLASRSYKEKWQAGPDRLYGAVISPAIQRYALDLARRHTATTSLKVYGA